jgi:hypothetical protein
MFWQLGLLTKIEAQIRRTCPNRGTNAKGFPPRR